ncbi:MAG: hypothetical protein IKN62_07885 [Elusimicrobia bacterium]|jgi:hypothetical protein|nr:hypothetical protein [Elusimicrobiota bacterium]
MEEQSQKECKTQKCCTKGIIIVIVCSLVCFFLGYYAGSKSLATVSTSAVNKPFSSSSIPKIPNPGQINAVQNAPKTNIPNVPNFPKNPIVQTPKIQTPPVPNTPNVQAPKVNIPDEIKEKAAAQAKSNNTQAK